MTTVVTYPFLLVAGFNSQPQKRHLTNMLRQPLTRRATHSPPGRVGQCSAMQRNATAKSYCLHTYLKGPFSLRLYCFRSWSNRPSASKSLSALHRSEAVVVMALIGAALGATALFSSLALKTHNLTPGFSSCPLVSFNQWLLVPTTVPTTLPALSVTSCTCKAIIVKTSSLTSSRRC